MVQHRRRLDCPVSLPVPSRAPPCILVPTVIADASNLLTAAVDKTPTPTRQTGAVVATVPADADPLPPFPLRNTSAHFIDMPPTACPGMRGYSIPGRWLSFVNASL